MSTIVEATDLSRYYGPVVGLNDLTVRIEEGVTGLLGPNGAGKSTFLKLVAGEIRPSRGRVTVLGYAPFANREYFRRVGFCPQQDALYGEMTGLEFVAFLLRLSGFSRADANARAVRALERVGLADAMERRTRGYSKGMRQRARLAQAIAHDPRLLIVDEPMSGLDPLARRAMTQLFHEIAGGGVSILISSHILHEVEGLTRNVVLLHRGRLLAQGPVPEIRGLLSRHPRKVELRARNARALASSLLELDHVLSVRLSTDGGSVQLETRDLDRFWSELPRVATETRAGVQSLESTDASLEAVFDYLVS
ncbi:MAG: ABC transporter ATP-binding protein [Planctomycetes bacterium]|nr:ABC transporter ATP-binding protein [Planctomycetota bacterium]